MADMVFTSQTAALSIAYLRNLRAHCDAHRSEILSAPVTTACQNVAEVIPISTSVAPTVGGTTVQRSHGATVEAAGNVWGVPAQSVISPLQASLSPRSEDEQPQQELTGNEPPPPGLSHHILDV